MSYFHSQFLRSRGGRRGRVMRRVCGETIEEQTSVARRWPESMTINWPRRTKDAYRSKSLPLLFVDGARDDILRELESVEVPEEYITVLTMMTREQFFNEKCGGPTEDSAKFFEREIRGKIILLVRSGKWVDQPESLSLKKLNNRIEKYDLGRRSDLNFSSSPTLIGQVQKYDPDFRVNKDGEVIERHQSDIPNFDEMYQFGTPSVRQELWDSRPWMQSVWRDLYGEPEEGRDKLFGER